MAIAEYLVFAHNSLFRLQAPKFWKKSPKIIDSAQQTQNICIKFVQRLPNVFDFGPKL